VASLTPPPTRPDDPGLDVRLYALEKAPENAPDPPPAAVGTFSLKSVVAPTNWLEALREKRLPPPSVDKPPIGLALEKPQWSKAMATVDPLFTTGLYPKKAQFLTTHPETDEPTAPSPAVAGAAMLTKVQLINLLLAALL
jgi:hypothetical protein